MQLISTDACNSVKNQQFASMSKYTQRVSNLPFEYSNKLVTPWGGLRYVQEFMEHCGFRQKLRELEFHKPKGGRRLGAS